MRKILLFFFLVFIISINVFALRLGVQSQSWGGFIQGAYYTGVIVNQTAPGYPAYGLLQSGDIITEGIIVPNSQMWNNPGNPNQGALISLNPYATLGSQLYLFNQYIFPPSYAGFSNWNVFNSFINSAPYSSNVIMRVFRQQWNTWTLVSIVLDSAGNWNVWQIPQQPQVQVQPGQPQIQVSPGFQFQIWIQF